MTDTHSSLASEASPNLIPPIADSRAPLSRSQVLLIEGGALVLIGWTIAIVASFVPIGYSFPLGAIVFVSSGLLSFASSGCAAILAVVALVVRRPWVPQSRFNGAVVSSCRLPSRSSASRGSP